MGKALEKLPRSGLGETFKNCFQDGASLYKIAFKMGLSFNSFLGSKKELRVLMLGLEAAGKTSILYKLHLGEIISTVPTVGFNVEKVRFKNTTLIIWDAGGQAMLRPLWRHYFSNTDGLIFVVDSLDRGRIDEARFEIQKVLKDPLMRNSAVLVFATKQDEKNVMTPKEIGESLRLNKLRRNRRWHIQGACATTGEGLHEGLDWLATTLKEMQANGEATCVPGDSITGR